MLTISLKLISSYSTSVSMASEDGAVLILNDFKSEGWEKNGQH